MLKFYSLRVQHDSVPSNGRYFLVTDGRWLAAYNEERYESSLFGTGAHRLEVGDNPSPTELAAAVKTEASTILAGILVRRIAPYRAVIDAAEIVETLDGELDIGWFMRTDYRAVHRSLAYLYRRLWADVSSYDERTHREARVDQYVERFMDKAKAAHTTLVAPIQPTAIYKGYSFTQRAYRAIR